MSNTEHELIRAMRDGDDERVGRILYELDKAVLAIADALALPDPHPSLVYAARYLLTEYDRADIPDWVEALANGNLDLWEDVVDEVRRLKEAEEMEDDSSDIDF